MHVETIFVRGLNAIFARNRLLRSSRADRGEISFFAVKPGAGVELVGYEDFAYALHRRGFALRADGLRADALARSSTTRASSGPSIRRRASRLEATLPARGEARSNSSSGRAGQRGVGRGFGRDDASACRRCPSAELQNGCMRRRARRAVALRSTRAGLSHFRPTARPCI